ncbi:putative lysin [Lactobacillus phage LL-Ku]|uniref:lysozyme n=1 Tax=Lactobacillus phage LL-Ku TaxID=2892343 RepID=F7V9F0_9CAUD|nr:putative lysin [Lactobacillus phage LL-Ku]AAV30211.2 putative lysin [Lactobacillus phage LL-Ku]
MTKFDLMADVSSYQPDTKEFFQALKDKGVKAVVVKITEGSNPGSAYVNPKAKNQIKFTRDVGMKVNAYHYAKFNGVADAQAEADWFVKNAKKLGIGEDSVMVLDYEDHATARANGTADINAFIQRVKNAGYPKTDIYSMRSWFEDGHIDRKKIIPKNIWVAAYGTDKPGLDDVGTWQFTSEYPVSGIKVDMSYDFNGLYTKGGQSSKKSPVTNKKKDQSGEWHSEKGTFTLGQAIYLRTAPSTDAVPISLLKAGSKVNYDAYAIRGGYVWIRQPRSNGYGYMATGYAKNGKRLDYWGKFS